MLGSSSEKVSKRTSAEFWIRKVQVYHIMLCAQFENGKYFEQSHERLWTSQLCFEMRGSFEGRRERMQEDASWCDTATYPKEETLGNGAGMGAWQTSTLKLL